MNRYEVMEFLHFVLYQSHKFSHHWWSANALKSVTSYGTDLLYVHKTSYNTVKKKIILWNISRVGRTSLNIYCFTISRFNYLCIYKPRGFFRMVNKVNCLQILRTYTNTKPGRYHSPCTSTYSFQTCVNQ